MSDFIFEVLSNFEVVLDDIVGGGWGEIRKFKVLRAEDTRQYLCVCMADSG